LYGAVTYTFKDKVLLNFCDGVIALEGEGPTTGGKARQLGAILASKDAVALDAVCLKLANLEIEKSPITLAAMKADLGTGDIEKINIIGDSLDSFNTKLVEPQKTHPGMKILKYQWMKNILLELPKINKNLCIKCGECTKICPPQTLKIKNGNYPTLKNSRCIRCWCCAEVCTKGAITKGKRPLLGRIIMSKAGK
jgi:Pyruvate/2-oxoacid:ferredoxin oxidoreductase delta subunit